MVTPALKVLTRAPTRGRIAFVTPRYGDTVVGGSEAVVREAAHGLAERGYDVEVLTTCAVDHYTWASELEPGTTVDRGVTVRRFPTVLSRHPGRWTRMQERLLAGERLDEAEELVWINGRFRVPDLYLYLAGHAEEYAAIIFSPYLFWSTLYCTADRARTDDSDAVPPRRAVRLSPQRGRRVGVVGGRLVPVRAGASIGPPPRTGGGPSRRDRRRGRRTRGLRP